MRFRPCIDIHRGVVKQIVGSTLREGVDPITNFAADKPAAHFANLYRRDGLYGGHVIMLGPDNEDAATQALAAFPNGLQIGGGMTPKNGPLWLRRGAAGVIVTSYIFEDGRLNHDRLRQMVEAVGAEHLILDLSCGKRDDRYVAMTNRWQTHTNFEISRDNLALLAASCCEFLIHATTVEGKQQGIDADLVALLGDITPVPTTYAGGIRNMQDITMIQQLGQGRLDYTVGSGLDIFGGQGLRYRDLVDLTTA
jgi:phosphoribosylformimino-5-aminoimidazole carboxamide ribotide isomerase